MFLMLEIKNFGRNLTYKAMHAYSFKPDSFKGVCIVRIRVVKCLKVKWLWWNHLVPYIVHNNCSLKCQS